MGYAVRVGDKIRLRLALEGQETDTGVVVKCVLRNAANTQIGSTLTLAHIGEGVFKDDSVDMPDTPVVSARFIVYETDGTTIHPDFFSSEDVFTKDISIQAVMAADLTVAASSTTTSVRTNATQASNFYDEMVLVVINSAGIAARRITAYANTNGAFTVTPALPFTPATSDRAMVLNMNAGLLATTLATAASTIATNLDATISSRAAAATALSTAQWTNTRAGFLDNLDAAISTRAAAATALSTVQWTNVRAALLDNLDAAISTRAAAATALSTAQWTNTRAGLLDNLDAAISSRAAAATALSTAQWTNGRASNLDNLDATVSSRASQTSVDAIQNNTRFVGIVPAVLKLPTSGSVTYTMFARLYDSAGNPEAPDGNMTINIKTTAGVDVVAATSMTNDSTGVYHYDYTVNSSDTERPLNVFFTYAEGSVSFNQPRVTEVAEHESKLDTLLSRLSSTRATNLDFLDVAISSRESESSASTRQTADIAEHDATQLAIAGLTTPPSAAAIADAVWDEAKSGHNTSGTFGETNQTSPPTALAIADQVWDEALSGHLSAGSTGEALNAAQTPSLDPGDIAEAVWDAARASYTDVGSFGEALDAKVSTRESEADAATRAATDVGEHNTTQAAIAALPAAPSANAIADQVWDEARAGHVASGSFGETNQSSPPTVGAIADQVWDEALAGHLAAGSTGEALNASQTPALDPDDVAAAVWNAETADYDTVDTFGKAVGDIDLSSVTEDIKKIAYQKVAMRIKVPGLTMTIKD